jgi:Ala-tRNA(Pro) deacylase
MAATPEDLFARLSALGIETETTEHAAVFTVEEARALRGAIAGGHCKTLFLKDKSGAL